MTKQNSLKKRTFRKLRGGSMGLKGKDLDLPKLLEMTYYRPSKTESSHQNKPSQ